MQIIKPFKASNGKNHFETKILMHMHVSLIKLLSVFVTTEFEINIQCSMTKTHLDHMRLLRLKRRMSYFRNILKRKKLVSTTLIWKQVC